AAALVRHHRGRRGRGAAPRPPRQQHEGESRGAAGRGVARGTARRALTDRCRTVHPGRSKPMSDPVNDWMQVRNADEVPSPALLVYTDRVATNLDRMVEIAGDPARLRQHVKTHKTPQLVAMQVARGITRCKAATIAEAEMAAAAGATDVLLATQPVGPAMGRLLRLVRAFPG